MIDLLHIIASDTALSICFVSLGLAALFTLMCVWIAKLVAGSFRWVVHIQNPAVL